MDSNYKANHREIQMKGFSPAKNLLVSDLNLFVTIQKVLDLSAKPTKASNYTVEVRTKPKFVQQ